ncbi:MAG: hypothetical protein GXO30_03290 [Epsilonproteobacteria bacterium]|nr:hypothetical protein [Campylobacterota bacterium]
MKKSKFFILVATILVTTSAEATLKNEKITLKSNMVVKYNQKVKDVDSLSSLFLEGRFYGRLRTNTFLWDWRGDITTDNRAMGVGGSLVYKTASLYGWRATAGLYTSQNPSFFREDIENLATLKAGKDTLSRYDTTQTGRYGMSVVGQSYMEYYSRILSFKVGRQLVESTFTSSNDSKMIPNSFDGISALVSVAPKVSLNVAYLMKQKLRDHTSSHDVIAYDPNNAWNENDDSAINRNLTLQRVGSNNKLILGMLKIDTLKNNQIIVSAMTLPSILTQIVGEFKHTFRYGDIKISPAIKYMQQFDNLNADYSVANLKANEDGYRDINSLNSSMIALKVDFRDGAFFSRVGYSKIADKADIIAPWKAKPTGGYTRAMSQVNWYANTKTYMLRVGYDFDRAKIFDGFSLMARYAVQDFDDLKAGVQADTDVIHIDARQNIGKNMEAKLRLGFVDADVGSSGKTDVSYSEYRVEFNYFF